MTDERAVSEVVGFVLVFSLVLGTITLVYVGGFTGLQDTRDHEQMANAERAFDVLANNLEELGQGKAPSRATEIKLSDATLRMGQRYHTRVSVDGDNVSVTSPRPISYDNGDGSSVVYEQGAVIRVDDNGGATMLGEPDYIFNDERTVLRHIEPRGGKKSVGGSTTVLVRAERNIPRLAYSGDVSNSDVEIFLETSIQRAPVWEAYLEERASIAEGSCDVGVVDSDEDRAVVTCDMATDQLYVTRTLVDVEFS